MRPSLLLTAACRIAGLADRVSSVVRAQRPPKGLTQKAYLHGIERREFLTLYKRHRGFLPGPREGGVVSFISASSLLPEVPGEVLAVVGVGNLGNVGLDMRVEVKYRLGYLASHYYIEIMCSGMAEVFSSTRICIFL